MGGKRRWWGSTPGAEGPPLLTLAERFEGVGQVKRGKRRTRLIAALFSYERLFVLRPKSNKLVERSKDRPPPFPPRAQVPAG